MRLKRPKICPTIERSVFVSAAMIPLWLMVTGTAATSIDPSLPDVFPAEITSDWKDQDKVMNYDSAMEKIRQSIPAEYSDSINGAGEAGYLNACHWRRVARMKPYSQELGKILFARHHNFGGNQVGYHTNVVEAWSDPQWSPNSGLCLLEMKTYYSKFTEIISRTDGVVRDPCISFDGKKVLFVMSGRGKGSGYSIYETEIGNPAAVRQLTSAPDGMVVADIEPCYLPGGDIAFSSTRNFGSGADGLSPVTNMFLMDGNGKYIRRVGFDQVHTFYPVLREDGSVLYTRWEYNDREVTGCMGLFVMNPDGCHQTEWFGNQTGWPLTAIHARPIPGTRKVMAIAGGHLGPYAGELMILDPEKGVAGFNGRECVQMIAPRREPKPDADAAAAGTGGVHFTFQTPLPFDEDCFLVSWRTSESDSTYRLYFMDADGNRELLAWADQSLSQPVLVKPPDRVPPRIVDLANYNDSMGIYSVQDVYYGEGMKGIDKASGIAKTLRVVRLNYRPMGAGLLGSTARGEAPSGEFVPTVLLPVSRYGASWDTKEVLGEAKIYPDGSTSFKVPARTPVYFQVLDSSGYCIAGMRSWSTLMPGETFSCTGCHENRNDAPPAGYNPQGHVFQDLDTSLGIECKPFDYHRMVQPIFDRECVRCHGEDHESGFDLRGDFVNDSLSRKSWTRSYTSLTQGIGPVSGNKAVNICTIFSKAEQVAPYSSGSSKSGIMNAINGGVPAMSEVHLTQKEKRVIACWIDLAAPHSGGYAAYMSSDDVHLYDSLAAMREKWASIEADGLKELAMLQPSAVSDGNFPERRAGSDRSVLGYVPARHCVVLRNVHAETFQLADLRGRCVFQKDLSQKKSDGDAAVFLPSTLSPGFYVAAVKTVNGASHQAGLTIVR